MLSLCQGPREAVKKIDAYNIEERGTGVCASTLSPDIRTDSRIYSGTGIDYSDGIGMGAFELCFESRCGRRGGNGCSLRGPSRTDAICKADNDAWALCFLCVGWASPAEFM